MRLRGSGWMAGLVALAVTVTAVAGPLDWLHRRKKTPPPKTAVIVANQAREVVTLTPGKQLRVRIGPESPTAEVGDKTVRYLRFMLPQSMPAARIEIELPSQSHRTSPRFTVLAPQIVLLDAAGEVIRTVSLQPLQLNIEPFQRTRLTGCADVKDLGGFLLTTDPEHVGHDYEFNARTKAGTHPDRGFYSTHSSLQVFMRYADSGDALMRVVPTPPDAAPCQPPDDEDK